MEKSVNGKLLLDLLDPPQKTRVQVTLVLKYYCIELSHDCATEFNTGIVLQGLVHWDGVLEMGEQ